MEVAATGVLHVETAINLHTGAGRIHDCLRNKREQLTSRCAEEEAKLEGAQVRASACNVLTTQRKCVQSHSYSRTSGRGAHA